MTAAPKFSRAELESFRDATVPDLVGPGLRLLISGINPGLWTAATQTHFAHPVNRFYPALRAAGIITRDFPSTGTSDADKAHLIERGVGLTNIAPRATARADELSAEELVAGGIALQAKVRDLAPAVIAIAGITAYRAAFAAPKAVMGRQPERWGESIVWVLPNPSGLNAHESVASLAAKFAEAAQAAGIPLLTV